MNLKKRGGALFLVLAVLAVAFVLLAAVLENGNSGVALASPAPAPGRRGGGGGSRRRSYGSGSGTSGGSVLCFGRDCKAWQVMLSAFFIIFGVCCCCYSCLNGK